MVQRHLFIYFFGKNNWTIISQFINTLKHFFISLHNCAAFHVLYMFACFCCLHMFYQFG